MRFSVFLGLLVSLAMTAQPSIAAEPALRAGFSEASITPPAGVGMTGFGQRDHDAEGNRGVHDDVFVTGLWLEDGGERVVILGYDVCFFSRDEADRLKGALGREYDLAPAQILINASHNHTSPRVGKWYYAPSDENYLQTVVDATVRVVGEARENAEPCTMWAGEGESKLPINRRLPNKETGTIDFAPNPAGASYRHLPVVMLKDAAGKPKFMMFSVAAHPSNIKGNERAWLISADYPGVARREIKRELGLEGLVFLQGAAGSCKCSVNGKSFPDGSFEDVEKAGAMVAREVGETVKKGLREVAPALAVESIEMHWPLEKAEDRAHYAKIAEEPIAQSFDTLGSPEDVEKKVRAMWARDMVERLDRGQALATSVPITAHGIRLGEGLRMVAIEGELVATLGEQIRDFYTDGVTLVLGYSNGCQMYLPTSEMMKEGGYEAESWWEYRHPAPLAPGMEKILQSTLQELRRGGIG